MALNVREFTSSGTFTVPSGVSNLIIMGCAGGTGGVSGIKSSSTTPNGWQFPMSFMLSAQQINVTPNTSYTVTIGTGGTGGASTTSATTANEGSPGGVSSFGSLVWGNQLRSGSFTATNAVNFTIGRYTSALISPGVYANGTDGATVGGYRGGGGSAAGSFGVGADGGTGNNAGAGGNGSNAAYPGGAGGNGGNGSVSGGAGGDGYKGIIIVMWED